MASDLTFYADHENTETCCYFRAKSLQKNEILGY